VDERDDFLPYYLDELAYLRRMGREFAHSYPKIAARLELASGLSTDPHVERLIESFAFLTARLERRLDLELPEIGASLLGVLYPNLVNPVPPLSIARFQVDAAQDGLTTGRLIPRHTRLFAQTRDGSVCRFRTCYPVELWPVEIAGVDIAPRSAFSVLDRRHDVSSVLRIQIEQQGAKLDELDLRSLRFYLNGDSTVTSALYELMGQALCGVALASGESTEAVILKPDALVPVGFADDEDAIPSAPNSHPGYRLLQEYLQFPIKFHFFDLRQLDRRPRGSTLDIYFLFDRNPSGRLAIEKDTVLLGCTPIVNLFARTSEPIRIDHRVMEHRLVADARREAITEIHSIVSMSASADPAKPTIEVQPYFSARHTGADQPDAAFWHARRAPTGRADLSGTDMWVSFVDLGFDAASPPTHVLYAHTLCTNRELAVQLPDGAALQIEEAAPITRINCIIRPTDTAYPAVGGESLWKLVSTLSLNHLSLSDGPASLSALREILQLYNFSGNPFINRQIEGIVDLRTKPVAGRIGPDAWRGFCRGTQVTVVFDEAQYVGGSAFLFASVLHHFFALHTAVNSFTQVVMESLQRQQQWKRWPPLAGSQQVF
jgi:type VI secretion system protein ImpG